MTNVTERRTEAKHAFEQAMGYWNPVCGQVVDASPDWFEAWLAYTAVPWHTGSLPPKVKEFIYITLNASSTHPHEPALRQHIANDQGLVRRARSKSGGHGKVQCPVLYVGSGFAKLAGF